MNIETMIAKLREDQLRDRQAVKSIVAAVERSGRTALNATETAEFEQITRRIDSREGRLADLEAQRASDRTAASSTVRLPEQNHGPVGYTREHGPYSPESSRNGGPSFFRDLYRSQRGDLDAAERLRRNQSIRHGDLDRAISTTNAAGGEFVPPLWLEEEFVAFARAGRPTAEVVHRDTLPEGTDSLNIPKITTGTTTDLQANQNTGISQTDLATTSVSAAVYTVAGGQTISMQLVEQSPLNIDRVVLADLAADYARKVDQLVLNGSGTGQPFGILNQTGTNQVAYTDASPAFLGAGKLYSKLANAVQQINSARYLPPTHIVVHPRRWAWLQAQADSNGRPVVLPQSAGLFNAAAVDSANATAQGPVGELLGCKVILDANVPTNLGAGTNQDPIIILRADDSWLWEGQVRAEAFQQTYAQNLSLFVRLYDYVSFTAARYPASISVVNGTGLVAPTF